MVTEEQTKLMIDEYVKGRKFSEFIDKACSAYRTTPLQECQKISVWEYYKSVTDQNGCNKEKGVEGVKKEQ